MGMCRFCVHFVIMSMMLMASFANAEPYRASQTLPGPWKIQNATTPEQQPDPARWVQGGGQWRRSGDAKKLGVKTEDVHDLWYQQTLSIPADWQGKRITLNFERIEGDAIIFVDARRVAELLRPGGEIDITTAVEPGKSHALTIFVTRQYTGISRGFQEDVLRFLARDGKLAKPEWGLGITARVSMNARPMNAAISDVGIITSWRNKTITIDAEVQTAAAGAYALTADILDRDGKTVHRVAGKPQNVAAGRTRISASAAWENPIPWELDGAYLYTARVSLAADQRVVDALEPIRFGFREIWTDGRKLMMNGHESRWRFNTLWAGGAGSLNFFRALGYNVWCFQPNPTAWWRDWAESYLPDETMLSTMDEMGIGASLPAPSVSALRSELLKNPKVRDAYEREMAAYVRRWRNHPSILAWAVGMNTYNPSSQIAAQGMGRRQEGKLVDQAAVIDTACKIVKHFDATRLVYSHADGGLGDLATANIYLNFAPLQEREEWPMAWAKDGNMPFSAVEFGQPYTANFWKGKQYFLTEYTAMYLGERAYQLETEAALARTVQSSVANKSGHGASVVAQLTDSPAYWEFQRLFVRNTDRAWRTWGVNGGWLPWSLDTGFGDPPGAKNNMNRYGVLKSSTLEKPSWANPNFDIHREANQPLLAYIAGDPVVTDKTHSFYAGEKVRKQIAIVWDGPGTKTLTARWQLDMPQQVGIARGEKSVTLRAGDIVTLPIEFAAPAVSARTSATLKLAIQENGRETIRDECALQFFPAANRPSLSNTRIAVYDPKAKTLPWLRALGVSPSPWQPGESLANVDLLILGRESIKPGDSLGYKPEDIARGLRVIVMEQLPEIWEGLGFRSIEPVSRYVFARGEQPELMQGLAAEDLINWRGTPDLFPDRVSPRSHDVQHAPKWTNRHGVASAVLQIPEVVGFTPLLQTEFALNYSPLLRWHFGRGAIYFSSLDFSGRVGADPAATQLAINLLQVAAKELPPTRDVVSTGVPTAALAELGLDASTASAGQASSHIMLAGGDVSADQVRKFVTQGGYAFCLPQSVDALQAGGIRSVRKTISRVSVPQDPLFSAIGANLLRWRMPMEINLLDAGNTSADLQVLADGLFAIRRLGSGRQVMMQIAPDMLIKAAASDPEKQEATQMSVVHLRQLTAQMLTNVNATPGDAIAKRLTTLKAGAAYETLGHWQIMGPFAVGKMDTQTLLKTPLPGEESAIAGDTNPNLLYRRSDGVMLDWRKTVTANESGFLDLSKPFGTTEASAAFATRVVKSDADRTALLRIGADYWFQVWVNGKLEYRLTTPKGAPKPNAYSVKIPLKAGDNVITLKLVSGSKGFGFWANLSKPGTSVTGNSDAQDTTGALYQPLFKNFDPYEYHYW